MMFDDGNVDELEESCSVTALLQCFGAVLAIDLDCLASLHDSEVTKEHLHRLSEFKFSENLALSIDDQALIEICQKMDVLVSQLSKTSDTSVLDLLAVEYAAIYLNYTYRASPLESVWMDDESLTYQDAMFNIRKIYQKHGLMVENWRLRSEDHLVCQIEFIAKMLRTEGLNEESLREIATFYDEHLFRWFRQFRETVSTRCENEFYGLAARLTEVYLEALRDCIAVIIEDERPTCEQVEAKLAGRDPDAMTYELKFVPGHSPSW